MFTSFIHKHVFSKAPWSVQETVNGKLVISDYNAAFADQLRAQLQPEMIEMKTDAEVVQLWLDRYNYEHETPKLEVVHGEVGVDGRVNVKLEWNDAFIKMLRDVGVEGSSEDEMIRVYLATVTSRVDRDIADIEDQDGIKEHDPAIQGNGGPRQPSENDVTAIIDNMDPEILKMFEKDIRRRAAKRRK
jgi:hypothetical protein